MAVSSFDFKELIAPIDPDAFFRDTWEKKTLVLSRNAPDFYSRILTMRDVPSIIYFTRPRFLGFRSDQPSTALDGVFAQDAHLYFEREYDLVALSGEYAQSKSINIHRLERHWPPVAALCRSLEMTLRHPVDATMFLTPKDSQGAEAHYDNVDVFILQVHGTKHWRVYKPTVWLPLKETADLIPEEDLAQPIQEFDLNAGDLLYLPRGYPHEAFTSDRSSLHITVAVPVFRWADVLGAALARASQQNSRLRQAIPIGCLGDGECQDSLRAQFNELVQEFARSAAVEPALDALSDQFIGKMPALPSAHFVAPEEIERVTLDTVLQRAEGVICRLAEEHTVSIQFPGNRVQGPQQIAPALRFIMTTERFPVRALPGELNDSSKLVLAGRLIREGLLTIAGVPS
jgi:ribosomal protein L16 Arg81 hydroxylase